MGKCVCSEPTQSLLGTSGSQCFRLEGTIFLKNHIYTEKYMNHTFRAQRSFAK